MSSIKIQTAVALYGGEDEAGTLRALAKSSDARCIYKYAPTPEGPRTTYKVLERIMDLEPSPYVHRPLRVFQDGEVFDLEPDSHWDVVRPPGQSRSRGGEQRLARLRLATRILSATPLLLSAVTPLLFDLGPGQPPPHLPLIILTGIAGMVASGFLAKSLGRNSILWVLLCWVSGASAGVVLSFLRPKTATRGANSAPSISPAPTHLRLDRQSISQELITIGEQGVAAYLTSDGKPKARPRDLGEALHRLGGPGAMREAEAAVRRVHGGVSARCLEVCWDGIGEWRA